MVVLKAHSTTKDYIRAEEDFHKEKYIVKRTIKAEIRPEEPKEKAESCWENSWNEIQLKGPQRQKQTQEQKKKSGQAQLDYV